MQNNKLHLSNFWNLQEIKIVFFFNFLKQMKKESPHQDPMGYSKSSAQKQVCNSQCLHQNKQKAP